MGFLDDFTDDVLGIDDNKFLGIKNDDWDNAGKWVSDPVGQTIDYAHKQNWLGDDDYKVWNDANMAAQNVAMAAGGIMLAPVTGGASLGMTYGVASGAGLAAMNGADFSQAMDAGRMGGMYGAAGGALTFGAGALASGSMSVPGISGLQTAGGHAGMSTLGTSGITAGANIGRLAGTMGAFGVGGYGGARGAGMSHNDALAFGLGSGLGGYGATGKFGVAGGGTISGAGSVIAGAAGGGYLGLQAGGGQPQPDSGGGGGGNYSAPTSQGGNGTAGTSRQSKATKSVPEAQFLDGGGANWGNAGVGGVFGGLDNLRNKDKFVNTEELKGLYAQRGLGAFVK